MEDGVRKKEVSVLCVVSLLTSEITPTMKGDCILWVLILDTT